MIIPGFIISWVTFPGVIVHEFAHATFCRLTKTEIREICYFRFDNPAGYVVHELPSNVWKHILIGIGPFFMNTSIGLLLGVITRFFSLNTTISSIILWIAISIAMHSFPSIGDAKSIWRDVWETKSPIMAKVLGTPLVGIILLGALGSVFWLDAIYGAIVVLKIPRLINF